MICFCSFLLLFPETSLKSANMPTGWIKLSPDGKMRLDLLLSASTWTAWMSIFVRVVDIFATEWLRRLLQKKKMDKQ